MIPNNNFSVLPWYGNINEQNARRWWIYGRTYPLFTPGGRLLPFQIMREPYREALTGIEEWEHSVLLADGEHYEDYDEAYEYSVWKYTVSTTKILVDRLPNTPNIAGQTVVKLAAYDSADTLLGTYNPSTDYSGLWELPSGTVYVRVTDYSYGGDKISDLGQPLKPVVGYLTLWTKDGVEVDNVDVSLLPFFYKGIGDYDIIGLPETVVFASVPNGQYYCALDDGLNYWVSEVFTVVNDTEPYLKLEWWDKEDFIMDAGAIAYSGTGFRNILYLPSDIAKPEYVFEEEGETRDGYFFPTKMISEKKYRFNFLASEYLLDVLRFVRMADNVRIEKNGKTYIPDTFLITPEWENNGDVAVVQAEFECATVAKKIQFGQIGARNGDFNSDFNNDFSI